MQSKKVKQNVKNNKKAPQPLRVRRNVNLVETGENRTPRP